MGGALSVSNRIEKRLVVQLEQNPVAIRYWGYVEPGDTNNDWVHARGDPLNQGFFIMRVIDVDSLPSPYQPPNMVIEQCKSVGFAFMGIPGFGSTAMVTLAFLGTGSPNWKSPQWAIPPEDTTQHREVSRSVHIGRNTGYEVVESDGSLLLQKLPGETPGVTPTTPRRHKNDDDIIRPKESDDHSSLENTGALTELTSEESSAANSTPQTEKQNQPPESSKDDSPIAEVSQSVQDIPEPPPGVTFLDQKMIPCTGKGVDFNFEQYDIALRVPEGAVAKGEKVDIQLGVVSHARFSYPDKMKIVSPVVWLCTRCTNQFESFQKPVEITFAHFFDAATDDSRQKLCFLKGSHIPSVMSGGAGKRHYRLVETDGKASFHEDYGMLSTKHFCFACVAVSLESQDRFIYKSKYYLVAGIPKEITTPQWSAVFCVTFHLKTCLKTVRKQFDSEALRMLPPKEFQFKDCEDDAKLTLDFSRSIDGWTIARECLNKEIFAKDVDFSGIDPDDLEEMETSREYPPRFILTISGVNAKKDVAVAEVAFSGGSCPLSIELVLSKPVLPAIKSGIRRKCSDVDMHTKNVVSTHLPDFIEHTNWSCLIPHLVAKEMLTPSEVQQLLNEQNTREKGINFYLRILPAKGDDSYLRFYECLMAEGEHLGHRTLQHLLSQ